MLNTPPLPACVPPVCYATINGGMTATPTSVIARIVAKVLFITERENIKKPMKTEMSNAEYAIQLLKIFLGLCLGFIIGYELFIIHKDLVEIIKLLR